MYIVTEHVKTLDEWLTKVKPLPSLLLSLPSLPVFLQPEIQYKHAHCQHNFTGKLVCFIIEYRDVATILRLSPTSLAFVFWYHHRLLSFPLPPNTITCTH